MIKTRAERTNKIADKFFAIARELNQIKQPLWQLNNMKEKQLKIGDATLRQNPLTGDWLVSGQKDDLKRAYVCDSLSDAKAMAKTINHYNKTGEKKAF